MASHEQSYPAGETKGQAQEKMESMTNKGRKAGQAMKDKANEAEQAMKHKANAAKYKESNTDNSARELAQEDREQTGSYLKEKTDTAKQKASETAQVPVIRLLKLLSLLVTLPWLSRRKRQLASECLVFYFQTGEQVKSMAQGAADALKHTLGMGEKEEDKTAEIRNC